MKTTLNRMPYGPFVALSLIVFLVLGCRLGSLFKKEITTTKEGVKAGDYKKVAESVSAIDPKAKPGPVGGVAVRQLAELEPGVAGLEGDFERLERAALKGVIGKLNLPTKIEVGSISPSVSPSLLTTNTKQPHFVQAAFQATEKPGLSDHAKTGAVIAAIVGYLNDFIMPFVPPGEGKKASTTQTDKDGTSTFDIDIGRLKDGSTKFGIGVKTDVTKDGVTAKTEVQLQLEGQRCPNAEGQVPITLKGRISSETGGTVLTEEMTCFIRALVDDDANYVSSKVDIEQGTREVKNGKQIYVKSGVTYEHHPGDKSSVGVDNLRLIGASQEANYDDIGRLSNGGFELAYTMALTSLYLAQYNWQNGGCVEIQADSPGTVAVSSSTSIPVTVKHRFDGSEVPSKLDAALKGQQSVNPTKLAKTAGTLTYVAPGEQGQVATIHLTAVSKRGKAEKDLNANTGAASYQISGGLDDWQTDTKVCDIMKPFTLTGGGFTMQCSGGLSGTYTYTGPMNAHGNGTYTIDLPNGFGKPGSMTGQGPGSVMGYSGSGTEHYTLMPIKCN